MWMNVARPLVVLAGLVGVGDATFVASVMSRNPAASNTVMGFVIVLMALQAVMGVGAIVAGVWGPIQRWLQARAAHR